jgi:DNA-binding LacI/PurR family transcriptional regulator/DNA-binding transcriptional regulator YhcF (GntR family)
MKMQRFPQIAHDLEQKLRDDPDFSLPTLNRISERYGVSYPTAWRAAQLLIKKGLARSIAGKGLIAVRGDRDRSSPPPDAMLSVDKLCNTIREDIVNGVYKSGKPFPKAQYFMATYHLTRLTVTRAFRRLAAENLAHKQKNHWMVGARVEAAKTSRTPPVVLFVLTDTVDALPNFFQNQYLSPFVVPLRTELATRQISFSVAAWYGDPRTTRFISLEGEQKILENVEELGHRYCGAVICSVSPRSHKLDEIIAQFLKFNKPVVYFDSSDEGGYITAESPFPGKLFRLHFNEGPAVRLTLRALVDKGHRSIGVHGSDLYADWSPRRAALIKKQAAEFSPSPSIVISGQSENEWILPSPDDFVEQPVFSMKSGPREGVVRHEQELRTAYLRKAPSLVSLLTKHDVTALLAINDNFARKYYFWLRTVGIDVPAHLSVIGFDNLAVNTPYPISSIDFGFERLGYLAAHILIGDTNVAAERNGDIPGIPTLVDRGSVARPGSRVHLVRLLGSGR